MIMNIDGEKIVTKNVGQTQKLAAGLARKIVKNGPLVSVATVIGLFGDLGAGKTAFARGFAKALGMKERITSPTFVVLKCFRLHASGFKKLIHVDAYRIENPNEILELGWKQMIGNPENIIIVEWAERIKNILPEKCFEVKFKHLSEKERMIEERFGSSKKFT